MKKYGCLFLVIIIVVAGIAAFAAKNYYDHEVTNKNGEGKLVQVDVPVGADSKKVGEILLENNLIDDINIFTLYLRLSENGGALKAGHYEFYDTQSIEEIVDELIKGAIAKGVKVTLVEGYTADQIASTIIKAFQKEAINTVSETELQNIVLNPDNYTFGAEIDEYLKLRKPSGEKLEGFLYPDTYEFRKDATEQEIIAGILKNFQSKTKELQLEGDGRSFYENLVLASIIERESFTNDERPFIASVFDNRLAIGMLLQSDATVNYATKEDNPRPTFQDLATDSPYNTYKYAGLPPTPISNPRITSLEAAFNPADSDYYYFIHEQDGSGQVHFGRNQAEHFANVRKYLD